MVKQIGGRINRNPTLYLYINIESLQIAKINKSVKAECVDPVFGFQRKDFKISASEVTNRFLDMTYKTYLLCVKMTKWKSNHNRKRKKNPNIVEMS